MSLIEQDKLDIENQAKGFAAITNMAHQLIPVMTQSFDIRIKSGCDFDNLRNSFTGSTGDLALLLGKTIRVTVDWSMLYSNIWLNVEGGNTKLLLTEKEVKKFITNIGDAQKMYDLWKYIRDAKAKQTS